MSSLRIPTPWLSVGMARALSGMCPPVTAAGVRRAAEKLAAGAKPSHVIDDLLRLGVDFMLGRQVVETLAALSEAGSENVAVASTLAACQPWNTPGRIEPARDFVVGERLLQQLVSALSKSITAGAMHGIVLRAMYLSEADYPFLADLRASSDFSAGFGDLDARLASASPTEAGDATRAILHKTLDLLHAFIGDDLTPWLARPA